MDETLTADEAAQRLGVSRQTLYAYVSRGLIKVLPTDDPRRSRYSAAAVSALAGERRRGRRPKEVAKATLDWGLPVLETSVTLIRDGRLYYRGEDALRLAGAVDLETIAGLLWKCDPGTAFAPAPSRPEPAYAAVRPHVADLPPSEALAIMVAAASRDDATAAWRRESGLLARGCGDLVRLVAAVIRHADPEPDAVHLQLARHWRLDDHGADLLRRALVLSADHELNVSGFTARCIASAGASVRAAVLGGLGALSGVKHGAMTTRVESFWNGLPPDRIAGAMRDRLAGGEDIPGLGHPLYPDGDIRATALLDLILPDFREARELVETAVGLTGERPTIDVALVALRRHLGLPEGAAFMIFALGRTVGWIAQALEQRADGRLIRPRAVYRGPEPVEA